MVVSRTFVRTRWASDLSDDARQALRELSEVEQATVSGEATGTTDGVLNIHSATALSFVRKGYAKLTDDDHVQATEEGLIKIGKVHLSRSRRRRMKEAESLDTQASGKWRPVPAGYSAAAERNAKDAKRFWAQAVEGVEAAKQHLAWTRWMLKLTESWGDADDGELDACREDIEAAEVRLAQAKAHTESLKGEPQQRAA